MRNTTAAPSPVNLSEAQPNDVVIFDWPDDIPTLTLNAGQHRKLALESLLVDQAAAAINPLPAPDDGTSPPPPVKVPTDEAVDIYANDDFNMEMWMALRSNRRKVQNPDADRVFLIRILEVFEAKSLAEQRKLLTSSKLKEWLSQMLGIDLSWVNRILSILKHAEFKKLFKQYCSTPYSALHFNFITADKMVQTKLDQIFILENSTLAADGVRGYQPDADTSQVADRLIGEVWDEVEHEPLWRDAELTKALNTLPNEKMNTEASPDWIAYSARFKYRHWAKMVKLAVGYAGPALAGKMVVCNDLSKLQENLINWTAWGHLSAQINWAQNPMIWGVRVLNIDSMKQSFVPEANVLGAVWGYRNLKQEEWNTAMDNLNQYALILHTNGWRPDLDDLNEDLSVYQMNIDNHQNKTVQSRPGFATAMPKRADSTKGDEGSQMLLKKVQAQSLNILPQASQANPATPSQANLATPSQADPATPSQSGNLSNTDDNEESAESDGDRGRGNGNAGRGASKAGRGVGKAGRGASKAGRGGGNGDGGDGGGKTKKRGSKESKGVAAKRYKSNQS
ncbi:hypothetical protein CNMCM5623_004807 [Aspergillus felis]|uniref:Uncharacterized protein n=1 Tax=Aspergillus felis TaxID=1287682 RepID=A0A8H6QFF3_9EURO|nr:hypothetical protein CNMCM5623_004807 [Aspergillus felis]